MDMLYTNLFIQIDQKLLIKNINNFIVLIDVINKVITIISSILNLIAPHWHRWINLKNC